MTLPSPLACPGQCKGSLMASQYTCMWCAGLVVWHSQDGVQTCLTQQLCIVPTITRFPEQGRREVCQWFLLLMTYFDVSFGDRTSSWFGGARVFPNATKHRPTAPLGSRSLCVPIPHFDSSTKTRVLRTVRKRTLEPVYKKLVVCRKNCGTHIQRFSRFIIHRRTTNISQSSSR